MQVITVKGQWLNDCGHRETTEDREFQIVRTEMKGGWTFHTLATPWGEWQVLAEWRCKGEPRDIDAQPAKSADDYSRVQGKPWIVIGGSIALCRFATEEEANRKADEISEDWYKSFGGAVTVLSQTDAQPTKRTPQPRRSALRAQVKQRQAISSGTRGARFGLLNLAADIRKTGNRETRTLYHGHIMLDLQLCRIPCLRAFTCYGRN